jgi:predicted nuclease of predicted toxin-antitoxin system
MKIIIDECLPKRLKNLLPDYDVQTVPQMGLAGSKDTALLDALDARKIDVFITIDGNIEYQQNFSGRVFGTVVIRAVSNRFQDLVALESALLTALQQATPGNIIRIP